MRNFYGDQRLVHVEKRDLAIKKRKDDKVLARAILNEAFTEQVDQIPYREKAAPCSQKTTSLL